MIIKNIEELKIQAVKDAISARFSALRFDEELHKYTLHEKELLSVTTYIGKFHEPFQAGPMANNIVKYSNKKRVLSPQISTGYLINRWNRINEVSTIKGSRVHDYIENNYPEFIESPHCKQETGAIEFFNNLDKKYQVLFLELRMYSEEFLLAGTADVILINRETGNLVIADWKTNNKNLLQYYKDSKLLEPFSSLPQTALNEYSLQLSLYKLLLERATTYSVEDMWVIHLDSDDWTELDYPKRNNQHSYKYSIDAKVPVEVGSLYRMYRISDYSQQLLQTLENGQ